MNRQRKVVITVTYNGLGMIVDTKAEELDLSAQPNLQPNLQPTCNNLATDCISRQSAIDNLKRHLNETDVPDHYPGIFNAIEEWLDDWEVPSAQPDLRKYEYHYDHTDCIWYRPEARNRCPVTCAQYRDGWNDAMNYIFRDGKGYRPYKRGEQYEE